jgi:hypothetical protein
MRILIGLMLVTTIVKAQEVREPQRGEERREQRVERPEPVRVQPPTQEQRKNEPPRQAEPRPEPQRPIDRPPMVRPVNPPIFLDTWNRMNRPCSLGGWDRWDCRPSIEFELQLNNRRPRNVRRPSRLEMAPVRPRWDELTDKQKRQLLDARKDFRERVQRILNNP